MKLIQMANSRPQVVFLVSKLPPAWRVLTCIVEVNGQNTLRQRFLPKSDKNQKIDGTELHRLQYPGRSEINHFAPVCCGSQKDGQPSQIRLIPTFWARPPSRRSSFDTLYALFVSLYLKPGGWRFCLRPRSRTQKIAPGGRPQTAHRIASRTL